MNAVIYGGVALSSLDPGHFIAGEGTTGGHWKRDEVSHFDLY